MAPVIEIDGLRKTYRRFRKSATVALDGLDLEVPEGGVFGFLGPNGAGKTTTIRCILGLVAASAGRATLLGTDVPGGLSGVIQRVGSIVEAPALFPRFTGRRNLEILARIDGIAREAVEAALDRVGLTARGGDMVRTYSLGMKQRLGIAAALLKDPSLLILDEPANGLDPAGIVEVRDLLRSLGAEGRTVFVSSHILSEVQQIADRVAIVARGRLSPPGLFTRSSRRVERRASSSASRTSRRAGSRSRTPGSPPASTVTCSGPPSHPPRPTAPPVPSRSGISTPPCSSPMKATSSKRSSSSPATIMRWVHETPPGL